MCFWSTARHRSTYVWPAVGPFPLQKIVPMGRISNCGNLQRGCCLLFAFKPTPNRVHLKNRRPYGFYFSFLREPLNLVCACGMAAVLARLPCFLGACNALFPGPLRNELPRNMKFGCLWVPGSFVYVGVFFKVGPLQNGGSPFGSL